MQGVTDWKFGAVANNDDAVGSSEILDPENVLNYDVTMYNQNDESGSYTGFNYGSYATFAYISQAGETFRNHDARLIVDDLIVGTNQAADTSFPYENWSNPPSTYEITVGGSSNVFGLTDLTAKQVKRRSFGIALSFCRHSSGGALATQSYYLVVTGFGFEVPAGATITGVEIKFVPGRINVGGGLDNAVIYYVKARVHYSYNPVLIGVSKSAGYLEFEDQPEPIIPQNKSYQYMSYEDNEFRGQWRDVESIPSIKINVNTLPGELSVALARNLDSKETEYEEIELSGSGGEVLVTSQNLETVLAGEETTYGVGAGTDLEVDHTVAVKEYYGGYEPILTHEGEPILMSQGEVIVMPNGYPRGRDYYQGYVSDFGLIYEADKKNMSVKLLHASEEMNNEIYRSPDTLKISTTNIGNFDGLPFGGWNKYQGDIEMVGHTFTADGTYDLKRLVYLISGWRNNEITITVRTGNTLGSGTVLRTAKATIDKPYDLKEMSFAFGTPLPIVSGTVYNVVLTSGFMKQTGSQNHPAFVAYGNTYSGGISRKYGATGWVAVSQDIGFQTWQNGGNTRVTENSIDPSQIMRKVLDYNANQGGVIRYDASTIESSGTIVSAPFNANTIKEAADYVLKLTPSNWFYYIDPGELLFNLHPQPSVVTQWFTLKKDIVKLELHKNIEQIINQILFTGGGDPALYREYVDDISRSQWRKGLAKMSDNRVTDATTAELLMEARAGEVDQPIWLGTIEVLRAEHPRFIRPGELSGFRNFGNIIDYLTVQIMSVDVKPDTIVCELGTQIPKQSQRIEDIKRNLTRIEIENNPNAPS
jgi:hypothetical protein